MLTTNPVATKPGKAKWRGPPKRARATGFTCECAFVYFTVSVTGPTAWPA